MCCYTRSSEVVGELVMGTNKTPEFQLRAAKKYLSKFVDVKLRITPDERSALQAHAADMGESVSTFMKRAIQETMARDKQAK